MDHAITVRGVVITAGGLMAAGGLSWAAILFLASGQSDSFSASASALSDAKFSAGVGAFGLILIVAGFWA